MVCMTSLPTPPGEEDADIAEKLTLYLTHLFTMKLKRGGITDALQRARKLAARLSLPINPIGNKASKVGLPATYRPVGETCPGDCPLLGNGCYAQSSHVDMQARRASYKPLPSLIAAAAVMVIAARYRSMARLHISGDFMTPEGQLDLTYIEGLLQIAGFIRSELPRTRRGPVAYGYTHIDEERLGLYPLMLEAAGVTLLRSGLPRHGGAIVAEFDSIDTLERAYPGVRFAKCRAQLDDLLQCKDCELCWAPTTPVCVVFSPHGVRQNHIKAMLEATPLL